MIAQEVIDSTRLLRDGILPAHETLFASAETLSSVVQECETASEVTISPSDLGKLLGMHVTLTQNCGQALMGTAHHFDRLIDYFENYNKALKDYPILEFVMEVGGIEEARKLIDELEKKFAE